MNGINLEGVAMPEQIPPFLVKSLEEEIAKFNVLSTNTTDWNPEDFTDDITSDEDMAPQDPALLKKYFLVEGEQLLELFRFCPKCGHSMDSESSVRLIANGAAPVVQYVCEYCRGRKLKRWEGQKRASNHPSEKIFLGNLAAAVSAITTGLRYELKRWAKQLGLAMFSKTTFWKYFEYTKDAMDIVYAAHQEKVLDVVRSKNENETGLNLAADGSYDSRGYSALIGKAVVADLATKLVLHTEVLHRSETDNISGKMEVEGIRRMLRWIVQQGMRINSLTTDRSRNIGALLSEMRAELGPISHFYDGWHTVKWVGNRLHEESKASGCAPITVWTENVKTFLWKSIKTPETGRYTRCSHGPLEGSRPEIMIEGQPLWGTSVCEAKNALNRIHCRKEIFYPISAYHFYAKMTTVHFNTLQLAEMAGERKVENETTIKRKYLSRSSRMVFKTPADHQWRNAVFEKVLEIRRKMVENDRQDDAQDEEKLQASTSAVMLAEDAFDDLIEDIPLQEEMRPKY
ncbi:hypothetical protein OESDEN_19929 [Oesophagostomum dentatum]|uniref:Mutator-like transposase domain-containing protein n=1 Tax=Oesophagostomum dentatum TaxID=61180 RepID=A0A0B1S910_OESDE|nr:hypothetical protein OESDEN_19929 [Oesophagostomum dentatum]